MRLKYIIALNCADTVPYKIRVFPEYDTHSNVANEMTHGHLEDICNAGFCDVKTLISDDGLKSSRVWTCWGESESLGKGAGESDAKILNILMS